MIESYQRTQSGSFRLFCFHFAGGSAGVFSDWHHDLPGDIDVCPVQLPGRGLRFKEKPFSDLDRLTDQLIEEMGPLPEETAYAFFGYSMGALIAYEIARKFSAAGRPGPRHLFVGAQKAPIVPSFPPYWHQMDKEEIVSRLRQLGGTPENVLSTPGLVDIFLESLKADFSIVETYAYRPSLPLRTPITAYCGKSDWLSTPAKMLPWGEMTDAGFRLEMMPGGHFFIQSHRAELLARLSAQLRPDSDMDPAMGTLAPSHIGIAKEGKSE